MDRTLTRALLRPRRLAASAALFLLLSAGATSIMGLANAQDAGARPAQAVAPEPFSLPLPFSGDAGRYELVKAPLDDDARGRGFEEDRTGDFTFAVETGIVQYDADGLPRAVTRFTLNGTRGPLFEGPTAYDVEVGTGRPIAATSTLIDDAPATSSAGLLPGQNTTDDRRVLWRTTRFGQGGWSVPCLFVNPYQGQAAPALGDGVDDTMPCENGPDAANPNRYHRMVESIDLSEPRVLTVAVYLTHPDDVPRLGDTPDLRYWYREDMPYASMVEEPRGGRLAPGDRLVLTAFQRGTAAEPTPTLPSPLVLALLPGRPWGIDDTAVPHSFPLSAAYERARTDPQEPAFREFLAQHPTAYVAWAAHAAFDMDGHHSERWSFGVTDCTARHGVTIAQDLEEGIMLLPGVVIPAPVPAMTYRYEPEWEDAWGAVEHCLPPAQVPSLLPSAASLLSTWEMAMPGSANANASASWSVWISCGFAEGPCQPTVVTGGGQQYYYRISEPGYPAVDNRLDVWDTTELTWVNGRLSLGTESEQMDVRGESTPLGGPPVTPVGEGESVSSVSPIAGIWAPPTPAQAASVGFAAFLAALLYHLWPAFKTGALGLFSRVQASELLDNPVRAQLVAAVEAQPGIHHQQLVRLAGKGNGAAEHHLQKLVVGGILVRHKSAGYTCYFPPGQVGRREMASAHLLKSPVAKAIMAAAKATPGTGLAQIARDAGVSAPTVHYHAKRLQEAGLVRWQNGLYAAA